MKRNSFLLATSITLMASLSLSLSSCKDEAPIEKQKMTEMVADYYMLEGATKYELKEIKSLDMNLVYVDFLNQHGVTAAQFDSAVSYYSQRPIIFKEIYEDAIKIVNKKLDEVTKKLDEY